MPKARVIRSQSGTFWCACVLAASGVVSFGAARAQSVGADTVPAAPAPSVAAQPAVPLVITPSSPAPSPVVAAPLAPVQAPLPVAAAAPPPVPAQPVSLDHPKVVDSAKLTAAADSVTLFGIVGLSGEPAQGLQTFLATTPNRLLCQPKTAGEFVCLLPDGTDLAAVALVNGAARARDDAPDAYRAQEAAAQAARRGIWANLPPPPVVLNHPALRDTATVFAAGRTYTLDGLQGLGAPYTVQLQGYIAAHGDGLSCQPQPIPGRYVCVLPDGTDIAKVALVNGAARVTAEAADSYRVEQGEALANQRGYWLHPPAEAVAAARVVVAQPSECCAVVAGDDGGDGVAYVGGVPTAMIGGESVFLVFAGAAGWGYYDHWHRWHDAPYRYRYHMDQYHPDGRGLRGYPAGGYPRGGYPGGHPGGGYPGGGYPGGGFAGGHPGGGNPGGHPGGGFAGGHPGGGNPGGHPTGTLNHNAGPSGGNFVRPSGSGFSSLTRVGPNGGSPPGGLSHAGSSGGGGAHPSGGTGSHGTSTQQSHGNNNLFHH